MFDQGTSRLIFLLFCPAGAVVVFTLLFLEFGLAFLAGFFSVIMLLVFMCGIGVAVGKNRYVS